MARAPLALLLLLAAAAAPAAVRAVPGSVTCTDLAISLVPDGSGTYPGDCTAAYNVPGSDLFTTTSATPSDPVWTGVGGSPSPPAQVGSGLSANYTFAAGTSYTFFYTDSTGMNCSGSVQVTPCKPACSNVIVPVNASTNPTCAFPVVPPAIFANPPGFIDPTTAAPLSVTGATTTLISTTSIQPTGTVTGVTVGNNILQVTLTYPYGIDSPPSDVCTIRVVDITPSVPAPTAGQYNCFYQNDTSFQACVPLYRIATKPSGPGVCANGATMFLAAGLCTGETNKQACIIQTIPANGLTAKANGICVIKRLAKKVEKFTVAMSLIDANGALPPRAGIFTEQITYYKNKKDAPEGCAPSNWFLA